MKVETLLSGRVHAVNMPGPVSREHFTIELCGILEFNDLEAQRSLKHVYFRTSSPFKYLQFDYSSKYSIVNGGWQYFTNTTNKNGSFYVLIITINLTYNSNT